MGLASLGSVAHADYVETFDTSGSLGASHLSRTYMAGSGTYAVSPLDATMGAPTNTALSVSAGGDNELRYFEGAGGIAGTHSYAVTPDTFEYTVQDATVKASVGIGVNDSFGGHTAGVMSRVSGNSWGLNGYVASVNHYGTGSTVSFGLSYMVGGVIHADYILATGGSFAFDYQTENLLIELTTSNNLITASLYKETTVGMTHLSTISALDSTYASGVTGVFSFVRGTNSIFFDDVQVSTVPVPAAFWLFGSALSGLLVLRRRSS